MFVKIKNILDNPFWVFYAILFLIYASAEKHMANVFSIPRKIMIPIGGHTPTTIASSTHFHQSEEGPDVPPPFAR